MCGDELPVGEQARWDPRARTVTCVTCAAWAPYLVDRPPVLAAPAGSVDPVPSAIGVAGGSALREYARRRDARERQARERAGIVGVWFTRLVGDPQSTHWWKQGGEGEAKVARRLERLLDGSGVHLLHDRRVPRRRRANIDHVAVGPGGVTVIDAKTVGGKVRVDSVGGTFGPRRQQLRVKGHNRTHLAYGVRAQAESVRALLSQRGFDADVRAALCFAKSDGLPWFGRLELEDVTIGGPTRVAKLARRPGPHSEEEVRGMVQLLATGLPAA